MNNYWSLVLPSLPLFIKAVLFLPVFGVTFLEKMGGKEGSGFNTDPNNVKSGFMDAGRSDEEAQKLTEQWQKEVSGGADAEGTYFKIRDAKEGDESFTVRAMQNQLEAYAEGGNDVDYEAALQAAKDMAFFNIENAPATSEKALEISKQRSMDLNKILFDNKMSTYEQAFGKNFAEYASGILESTEATRANLEGVSATAGERLGGIFDDVRGLSEQFLSGGITDESQKFMSDMLAERGYQKGLFGEARDLSEARHFGQLVEERQVQGAQLAGQAGNIAIQDANLQAALAGGVNDINRLLTMLPDSLMPTADPVSLFAAESNRLAGASLISPMSAMQTVSDISQFNASQRFDALLSNTNLSMDLFQTEIQRDLNQQKIDVAEMGNYLNFGASVIGSNSDFMQSFL